VITKEEALAIIAEVGNLMLEAEGKEYHFVHYVGIIRGVVWAMTGKDPGIMHQPDDGTDPTHIKRIKAILKSIDEG
jgi:hypothetical protein